MDVNALNVVITTTGAPEAERAFGRVDAEAQKIRDSIAKALAQTNGDLSKIGQVMNKTATTDAPKLEQSINRVQTAARSARIETDALAASTDALGIRGARALQGISRGFEVMARTGSVSGRSLDQMIARFSQLALGFGEGGLLVGAVGIGTAAIVEMFTRTRRELEKTAEEFAKQVAKMANAGRAQDLQQQARNVLYGQPYDEATGKPNAQSKLVPGAYENSLAHMQARFAQLSAQIPVGATMAPAKIADEYNKLSKAIDAAAATFGELRTAAQDVANQPADMGLLAVVSSAARDNPAARARLEEEAIAALAKSMPRFNDGSVASNDLMRGIEAAEGAKQLNELIKKYNPFADRSQERKEERDFGYSLKAKASAITLTPTQQAAEETIKAWTALANRIGSEMASTVARSLSSGFESLFSRGGSLKSGFKAMTGAILEGLGSMFEQIGEQALAGMTFMKAIKDSLLAFAPEIGIPAAIGLIALGAALKGAGSRIASSGSGGGGGSYSASAPSAVSGTYYVNPSSPASHTYSAAGMQAAQPVMVNATFIGTRDPKVQRELLEMIRNAQQRGSVG